MTDRETTVNSMRSVQSEVSKLGHHLDEFAASAIEADELRDALDDLEDTIERYRMHAFLADEYAPKFAIQQLRERFDLPDPNA